MNKTLLVIGAILVGIGLFAGGFFFSQQGWMMGNGNGQANPNMMGNVEGQYTTGMTTGSGIMGNSQFGNMMGNGQYNGMMDGQYGSGMMGMMMDGSQFASGMMGNFGGLSNVDPMSLEDAETAVTDYLATLNNNDLALGEIMIFENHAYAQIIDETTETGAFELLVDPVTGNVFPEPGPNMMWNTQYGMMSGADFGMMDGQFGSDMMGGSQFGSDMMNEGGMMGSNMMGNFGYAPDAEINITAEEAVTTAQEYLDAYLPGKTADETADAFPGYYTLHVLENGETIGMLSVNAYTGQVFLHHWHGDFIEMVDGGHE